MVLVWWWIAALAGTGCGTTTANLREWDSVYLFTETTSGGAFVAEEWADSRSTEGVQVDGRRPSRRRGGGEPGRRQPPLLNPRPTPEQQQAQQRRAADLAVVLQARQLYVQRLKEAQERYPNSAGYENHHFVPRYLNGPKDGKTFRIPTAYHKAITQAFRRRWAYRQGSRALRN